jgi:hypothetical protein
MGIPTPLKVRPASDRAASWFDYWVLLYQSAVKSGAGC